MSMTRQMAALIATLLLAACGGVWALHLWALQASLREQLGLRNVEAATELTQALAQLAPDEAAWRAALNERFDQGGFSRLALRSREGQLIAERRVSGAVATRAGQAEGTTRRAPAWFAEWAALERQEARAPIVHQGRELGMLFVQAQADSAVHGLWLTAMRSAAWLALLTALGMALAVWRLRRWRAPLTQMAAQAKALQEGRFQFTPEPREDDLRAVVKSMNALVARLADQFAAQSTQVHTLQRLAHADAITGLARREAFLRRVAAFSEMPECLGLTLIMLRMKNLALLNEVSGHETVDGFLGAVGDMLDDYPRRVNGALAGRLNGTDLAVFLPAKGVVRDTAQAMADTLAALAERSLPGLEFALGAVESTGALPLAELLAACDTALAQSEWCSQGRSQGPRGEVVVRMLGDANDDADGTTDSTAGAPQGVRGSRGWRTRISAALDAGRVSVAEFAVVGRHGQLLHLECPLRVQPEADGPVLPAREWLPWASRSALLPRLELAGLAQVLAAIAADGVRRSMHLCESSIVQSGAVQTLTAVLDDHSGAAPLLCLEIAEATWARAPAPLAALGAALRERGVAIGLEHAGMALPSKSFVQGIALAYVKIDARYVRQANSDAAARDLAVALVRQARSLGALAIAEGVADADEVQGLFSLGFDGVTGPGVLHQA